MAHARHPTILERVTENTTVDVANNADLVDDLIEQSTTFIAGQCRLPIFPDASQGGTSIGGAEASEDLSSLASNSFRIQIDAEPIETITVTLASMTTGALAATELQAKIRAAQPSRVGFANMTVTFSGSPLELYTFTSGTKGPKSRINIGPGSLGNWHVAHALKVGEQFGGEERPGSIESEPLKIAAAQLTIELYRSLGTEGVAKMEFPDGSQIERIARAESSVWATIQQYRRLF